MKNLILVLLTLILFTNKTKAQDNIEGWYVDGVKVDKLTCYGFKKLQLVVPYSTDWASYTHISVNFFPTEWRYNSGGVKLIAIGSIKSFVKGKYFVYDFFAPGDSPSKDLASFLWSETHEGTPFRFPMDPFQMSREDLKTDKSKVKNEGKSASDFTLNFSIYGLTQTGFGEEEDAGVLHKFPIYTASKISKTFKLLCTNRVFSSRGPEADKFYTETCTYPGTKVDFNNLK